MNGAVQQALAVDRNQRASHQQLASSAFVSRPLKTAGLAAVTDVGAKEAAYKAVVNDRQLFSFRTTRHPPAWRM